MADNGKTYTGTIRAIQGKKFKVKYDLSTSEAWLTRDQFMVTNKTTRVPAPGQNNNLQITNNNTGNDRNVVEQKSPGGKPTNADITAALKATWEHPQSTNRERQTVTINDIKIASSEKATLKHQYDGIPKDALVTSVKIDFTQNAFYTNETQYTRRIMTALVYKDQFGDWKIMNVGVVYPDK
jgi:hypothetical protein